MWEGGPKTKLKLKIFNTFEKTRSLYLKFKILLINNGQYFDDNYICQYVVYIVQFEPVLSLKLGPKAEQDLSLKCSAWSLAEVSKPLSLKIFGPKKYVVLKILVQRNGGSKKWWA